MTKQELIEHWRKGARDALDMARLALTAGKYDHVLFNCHLAIEKALKALYMTAHEEEAPFSHDLGFLAKQAGLSLAESHMRFLQELSDYAVDARYSDPAWAEHCATRGRLAETLQGTDDLFHSLLTA